MTELTIGKQVARHDHLAGAGLAALVLDLHADRVGIFELPDLGVAPVLDLASPVEAGIALS